MGEDAPRFDTDALSGSAEELIRRANERADAETTALPGVDPSDAITQPDGAAIEDARDDLENEVDAPPHLGGTSLRGAGMEDPRPAPTAHQPVVPKHLQPGAPGRPVLDARGGQHAAIAPGETEDHKTGQESQRQQALAEAYEKAQAAGVRREEQDKDSAARNEFLTGTHMGRAVKGFIDDLDSLRGDLKSLKEGSAPDTSVSVTHSKFLETAGITVDETRVLDDELYALKLATQLSEEKIRLTDLADTLRSRPEIDFFSPVKIMNPGQIIDRGGKLHTLMSLEEHDRAQGIATANEWAISGVNYDGTFSANRSHGNSAETSFTDYAQVPVADVEKTKLAQTPAPKPVESAPVDSVEPMQPIEGDSAPTVNEHERAFNESALGKQIDAAQGTIKKLIQNIDANLLGNATIRDQADVMDARSYAEKYHALADAVDLAKLDARDKEYASQLVDTLDEYVSALGIARAVFVERPDLQPSDHRKVAIEHADGSQSTGWKVEPRIHPNGDVVVSRQRGFARRRRTEYERVSIAKLAALNERTLEF